MFSRTIGGPAVKSGAAALRPTGDRRCSSAAEQGSHKPRVGGSIPPTATIRIGRREGRKEGRRGHRDFTSPFIGQSKEPPVRVFTGTLLNYWIVVLRAVL